MLKTFHKILFSIILVTFMAHTLSSALYFFGKKQTVISLNIEESSKSETKDAKKEKDSKEEDENDKKLHCLNKITILHINSIRKNRSGIFNLPIVTLSIPITPPELV
jgi:hypothetical protein